MQVPLQGVPRPISIGRRRTEAYWSTKKFYSAMARASVNGKHGETIKVAANDLCNGCGRSAGHSIAVAFTVAGKNYVAFSKRIPVSCLDSHAG